MAGVMTDVMEQGSGQSSSHELELLGAAFELLLDCPSVQPEVFLHLRELLSGSEESHALTIRYLLRVLEDDFLRHNDVIKNDTYPGLFTVVISLEHVLSQLGLGHLAEEAVHAVYGRLVINKLFKLLAEDMNRPVWQGPWHTKPFMERAVAEAEELTEVAVGTGLPMVVAVREFLLRAWTEWMEAKRSQDHCVCVLDAAYDQERTATCLRDLVDCIREHLQPPFLETLLRNSLPAYLSHKANPTHTLLDGPEEGQGPTEATLHNQQQQQQLHAISPAQQQQQRLRTISPAVQQQHRLHANSHQQQQQQQQQRQQQRTVATMGAAHSGAQGAQQVAHEQGTVEREAAAVLEGIRGTVVDEDEVGSEGMCVDDDGGEDLQENGGGRHARAEHSQRPLSARRCLDPQLQEQQRRGHPLPASILQEQLLSPQRRDPSVPPLSPSETATPPKKRTVNSGARKDWSLEQERAFLTYVKKYGRHWSTIYDAVQHDCKLQPQPGPWTLLKNRSKNQLNDKWKALKRAKPPRVNEDDYPKDGDASFHF